MFWPTARMQILYNPYCLGRYDILKFQITTIKPIMQTLMAIPEIQEKVKYLDSVYTMLYTNALSLL